MGLIMWKSIMNWAIQSPFRADLLIWTLWIMSIICWISILVFGAILVKMVTEYIFIKGVSPCHALEWCV